MRGLLIVAEGIDFSGKTTALQCIRHMIPESRNFFTSASDDSKTGRNFSSFLKRGAKLNHEQMAIMFSKARGEIIENIIRHMMNGINVWVDRFILSSVAYQHYGGMVSLKTIIDLHNSDCHGVLPDITIYFNNTIKEFQKSREYYRTQTNRGTDLVEEQPIEFMEKVLYGFKKEIVLQRFTGKVIEIFDRRDILPTVTKMIMQNKEQFY